MLAKMWEGLIKQKNQIVRFALKESAARAFLSLIFFKAVLDLSYYFLISPVWSHAGFDLALDSLKLIESYLLLFLVFALMPNLKGKLSGVVVWVMILLSYVPMLTLFGLKDESRTFMYAVTGFWLLVFSLLKILSKFSSVPIPPLKESQSKIIRNLIFLCVPLTAFVSIYKNFGFTLNFNLAKVYEIRKLYVQEGIFLLGYVVNWTTKVINPLLFITSVFGRKWLYAGVVAFLQIWLFSVTGNKVYLFALPFTLILSWVAQRKNPSVYMSSGLAGIVFLGVLSYWLVGDVWISSLFVRRLLLVPAQLSFLYYNFFSKNGYTFLSQHRIFRDFLDYPYQSDPSHLIGEVYFNKPEMSANVGLCSDGYLNFGFVGMVLWAVLLAVILTLIDKLSINKDMKITVAVVAVSILSIVNGALLTTLITHGLLLALILLYLLPVAGDTKQRNVE